MTDTRPTQAVYRGDATAEQRMKFGAQVEEIKSVLRKGGIHSFDRGYGKTTAILELCNEFGVDNCVIIVPNGRMQSHTEHLWWYKYGSDRKPPLFITWQNGGDDRRLMGLGTMPPAMGKEPIRIFIDGCDRMDRLGPSRELLEHIGFYCGVY